MSWHGAWLRSGDGGLSGWPLLWAAEIGHHLKTLKALGLTIPESVLVRADEGDRVLRSAVVCWTPAPSGSPETSGSPLTSDPARLRFLPMPGERARACAC